MILQKSKIYEREIFERILPEEDFITIRHEDKTSFYLEGLDYSVRGDYKKLISYFISRKQLLWWKMMEAAEEGNARIIDFFISQGHKWWYRCMLFASSGKHENLTQFFMSKENLKKKVNVELT